MQTRNSEVNKTYIITQDRWVLTLARKPNCSHPEHAFFILEGIQDEKATICFMDLVGPGMSTYLPNINQAGIRIKPFSAGTFEELEQSPLLFRCSEIRADGKKLAEMMDLKPSDAIATPTPSSWFIEKEDAERLIKSIREDKENPPHFNIFGNKSVFTASTAKLSSKERGHNCFTYAKEKIERLAVADIKIACDNTAYCMENIAAMSSFTLKSKEKIKSYSPYFFAKVALIGTAATAVAVETVRRYYYPSK